jgi:hypothetical protein
MFNPTIHEPSGVLEGSPNKFGIVKKPIVQNMKDIKTFPGYFLKPV